MNNTVLKLETDEQEIVLDYSKLRKSALILRALNHDLRQEIMRLLNENDSLTVTEIYVKLRVEQSVASQHLAILRKAGAVITKRNGKFIYYTVNTAQIDKINNFIEKLSA